MVRSKRDGVFERPDAPGWYASFIDAEGIRRKKRVVAHTRTQAIEALNALKIKAQKERILGVKHLSEITTADLFARYKRHQRTRLAKTTFERLGGILDNLLSFLPTKLKDINRASVANLIGVRAKDVAAGTIAKEIAILKHALRLAVEWDLLHANPADRARLPKLPEGRTRYLSPTELKALLEAAPEWMRPPIALAAFTGMRRGEILNLRWMDVDLKGNRVYLRETKNGALRILALNRLAAGVLSSLPQGASSDLVMPGLDGPTLSVYTRRILKSLGIEDASFHSLRHTAASWLVMQGVDLYAVGQVLGHKTPRMTQRYAHLSPQYMANAVGQLDKVFANLGTPTGLRTLQTSPKGN